MDKRADSTMVWGGRLEKTLTVHWFCEVGWKSFEKVADSTMVLGGRWKKVAARAMVFVRSFEHRVSLPLETIVLAVIF